MHLLKNKYIYAIFLFALHMQLILRKSTSEELKYCRGLTVEEAEVSPLPHDNESQKDNDGLLRHTTTSPKKYRCANSCG